MQRLDINVHAHMLPRQISRSRLAEERRAIIPALCHVHGEGAVGVRERSLAVYQDLYDTFSY